MMISHNLIATSITQATWKTVNYTLLIDYLWFGIASACTRGWP